MRIEDPPTLGSFDAASEDEDDFAGERKSLKERQAMPILGA